MYHSLAAVTGRFVEPTGRRISRDIGRLDQQQTPPASLYFGLYARQQSMPNATPLCSRIHCNPVQVVRRLRQRVGPKAGIAQYSAVIP
jgi:hypothetical protein